MAEVQDLFVAWVLLVVWVALSCIDTVEVILKYQSSQTQNICHKDWKLKHAFFARSCIIFPCLQLPRPPWPFKDKLALSLISVFLQLITTVDPPLLFFPLSLWSVKPDIDHLRSCYTMTMTHSPKSDIGMVNVWGGYWLISGQSKILTLHSEYRPFFS